MKVVLDDIEMNTGVPDSDGALWYVDGLDGWDGPPTRGGSQDFAQKDGAAPFRASYGPRALVLRGLCKTRGGEAGFWRAYNRLLGGVGVLSRFVRLAVTEDVEKHVMVRLEGTVKREVRPGNFVFEVPLMAMNPVKYGPEKTVSIPSGASRTLVNEGNYPSDGVEITATGAGRLRLRHEAQQRTLSTGTSSVAEDAVLNMRGRSFRHDGVDQYSLLAVTSNWWALNPGQNVIQNQGTAPVSIVYRPAWV